LRPFQIYQFCKARGISTTTAQSFVKGATKETAPSDFSNKRAVAAHSTIPVTLYKEQWLKLLDMSADISRVHSAKEEEGLSVALEL